jgi:hypothetical protein
MKRLTLKSLCAALIAIAAVPTGSAAGPTSAPVTVVNTPSQPVPVTVTNPSSGSANVTITNTATNPVKTWVDQYPRTPVAVTLKGGQQSNSYNVPDGSKLVIETVSIISSCREAPTETLARLAVSAEDVFELFIPLQLVSTFASNEYAATSNVRVVAPNSAAVSFQGVGCSVSSASVFASLFGYLISVNSPSLAP